MESQKLSSGCLPMVVVLTVVALIATGCLRSFSLKSDVDVEVDTVPEEGDENKPEESAEMLDLRVQSALTGAKELMLYPDDLSTLD